MLRCFMGLCERSVEYACMLGDGCGCAYCKISFNDIMTGIPNHESFPMSGAFFKLLIGTLAVTVMLVTCL